MLKETKNEESRLFCQIFAIPGISIVGARPPAYAYDFEIRCYLGALVVSEGPRGRLFVS